MNLHNNSSYIYLHGFASSPNSAKAKYFRNRFCSLGIDLKTPDLNQNDFSSLTLTRQLNQIETEFLQTQSSQSPAENLKILEGVTIIGSSFGGLTAAWLAQRQLSVKQIVLLAPAFQFLSHWLPLLGQPQLEKWQSEEYLPVYHYGEQRDLPLNYRFVAEMGKYPEEKLMRSVPTLILHGKHDTIIPIQASRSFAEHRPWVQLIELEGDHSLGNVVGEIWEAIQKFCQFPNSN
ncbi:prolyl oligopeptidase family serine peptidase [Microcoleus sp. LEGE 07076]|uniref:YqiA/YcfP family alpha/beta fold hydrolase n=1 Tax=Microcoleus sp. LEGE 07076 TaxID=915322 RepID=UPI0018826B04|nr:YqiA/YcfP family alpha/beta fold hydrolase [Microcoleus sp. LEGE 07076]MBE9185721.1 prolyl oligopeptidase family serine peptidase [Microcoleus sp. LEGE 07076]